MGVRVPRLPLRADIGLMVQQEDASSARWRSGCDSRWVHSTTQPRGPTATTLGPHPGNDGSTPSGATRSCVGWALAGPAGCKPVVQMDPGGSTPSRRTDNTARWSSGRMRDPHSRGMGSIPIRVTEFGEVVEQADTRRSEGRALGAWEFDSPLRH